MHICVSWYEPENLNSTFDHFFFLDIFSNCVSKHKSDFVFFCIRLSSKITRTLDGGYQRLSKLLICWFFI
jgi:hypothetical protein